MSFKTITSPLSTLPSVMGSKTTWNNTSSVAHVHKLFFLAWVFFFCLLHVCFESLSRKTAQEYSKSGDCRYKDSHDRYRADIPRPGSVYCWNRCRSCAAWGSATCARGSWSAPRDSCTRAETSSGLPGRSWWRSSPPYRLTTGTVHLVLCL